MPTLVGFFFLPLATVGCRWFVPTHVQSAWVAVPFCGAAFPTFPLTDGPCEYHRFGCRCTALCTTPCPSSLTRRGAACGRGRGAMRVKVIGLQAADGCRASKLRARRVTSRNVSTSTSAVTSSGDKLQCATKRHGDRASGGSSGPKATRRHLSKPICPRDGEDKDRPDQKENAPHEAWDRCHSASWEQCGGRSALLRVPFFFVFFLYI